MVVRDAALTEGRRGEAHALRVVEVPRGGRELPLVQRWRGERLRWSEVTRHALLYGIIGWRERPEVSRRKRSSGSSRSPTVLGREGRPELKLAREGRHLVETSAVVGGQEADHPVVVVHEVELVDPLGLTPLVLEPDLDHSHRQPGFLS